MEHVLPAAAAAATPPPACSSRAADIIQFEQETDFVMKWVMPSFHLCMPESIYC
jgi:hypothetical protein